MCKGGGISYMEDNTMNMKDIQNKLNNTDYHVDEEIYVSGLAELKDAVAKRYGEIYLQGELQDKLAAKAKKAKFFNTAGNILMVNTVVAWPFLLLGISSKAISGGYKYYKPVTLKVKGHHQTFKIVLKESEKKNIRKAVEDIKFKNS